MKMKKIFQFCTVLMACCALSQLSAQDYSYGAPPVGLPNFAGNAQGQCCDVPAQDCCGGSWTDDIYLRLGYTSARGIGRTPGYGTVAAYYTLLPQCGQWAPYVDVRGHYTDRKEWAVNSGFGLQYATYDGVLWRGYVYYDYYGVRRNHHNRHHDLDQVSFGFERIGQTFDFRGNVYLPTKERVHGGGLNFAFDGGYTARQSRWINTFRGADLSVSTPIDICDLICFYSTVGGYYYWTDHYHRNGPERNKDAFGVLVRLETSIWDGLVAGVQYTFDQRWQSNVLGEINWYFPLPGCKTNCNTCNDCFCAYPVRRQELIVTDRQCRWKTNY